MLIIIFARHRLVKRTWAHEAYESQHDYLGDRMVVEALEAFRALVDGDLRSSITATTMVVNLLLVFRHVSWVLAERRATTGRDNRKRIRPLKRI